MKILFFRETEIKELNPTLLATKGMGGTETSFLLLTQALSKYHEITAICPCEDYKTHNGVQFYPYVGYDQVISEAKFHDLLIVVGNPNILFKHNFDTKVIFWQHNHPEEMKHFHINVLLGKGIPLVFPSLESAEFAKKVYQNNNIYGIYNSVRDEFFEPVNVNKEPNKIVYVSSFSKSKGLYELIQAALKLPYFNFYLCGDFDLYGTIDQQYQSMCNRYFGRSNIIHKGSLAPKQIIEEIASAELCVVNPVIGNKETCCICALESMAVGTPVVAGGRSIIDPIIEHGGCSFDTIPLYQTITEQMGAPQTRYDFGKSGKEWAQQFRKENIAEQWKNLLCTIN